MSREGPYRQTAPGNVPRTHRVAAESPSWRLRVLESSEGAVVRARFIDGDRDTKLSGLFAFLIGIPSVMSVIAILFEGESAVILIPCVVLALVFWRNWIVRAMKPDLELAIGPSGIVLLRRGDEPRMIAFDEIDSGQTYADQFTSSFVFSLLQAFDPRGDNAKPLDPAVFHWLGERITAAIERARH